MFKKTLFISMYLAIAVLVGVTAAYAGNLTPPGPVANTMYTLTDIWNLASGITTTLGTGTIPTTPGTVAPTLKSLTEVYDALSTELGKLTNNEIAKNVTAFGFTGALYGDTDPAKVLTTAAYPGTASSGGILKTGQAHCNAFSDDYNNSSQVPCTGTNQDGDLQKGTARSYTDNTNGTITDNSTGLMWQKCADGQDPLTCDGDANAFIMDDGNGNSPAISYCESLSLGGHTDWHLPNVNQLQSIVDYGHVFPAINPVFANAQSKHYWSSTAYEDYSGGAWVVYFYDGYVGYDNMSGNYFVRCVR